MTKAVLFHKTPLVNLKRKSATEKPTRGTPRQSFDAVTVPRNFSLFYFVIAQFGDWLLSGVGLSRFLSEGANFW